MSRAASRQARVLRVRLDIVARRLANPRAGEHLTVDHEHFLRAEMVALGVAVALVESSGDYVALVEWLAKQTTEAEEPDRYVAAAATLDKAIGRARALVAGVKRLPALAARPAGDPT